MAAVADLLDEGQYKRVELDLVALVDSAVDPHTNLVRDMRIDDRDIPEFPNIFEFCISKAGLGLKPFSRQIYVLLMLFGEICPRCTDPKIKDVLSIPVNYKAADLPDKIQMLHFGKCPKCKKTKLDFYKAGLMRPYQELSALLGQRAGKSTMLVAPAVVYLLHKYVKLPRPYEIYGLNPTTLVGTLVAQTFQNAYEQLWLPVKTYIEASQWYNDLHDLLKHYENRYGEEIVKFQTQSIHYAHRQLMLYPAGPNRKLLRGKTRWCGAIDEWDFFDSDDDSEQVRMNGTEVYASLDNSLSTVRVGWKERVRQGYVNVPNAFFMTASSPQHGRGVLVKHVNANLNSKTIYALHLPTWEINPRMTRKALQSFFDRDPVKAERDFGANPPLVDNAFIEDHEAVERLCSTTPNRVDYKLVHKKGAKGTLRGAKLTRTASFGIIEPSILAIDAGYTNNSFALTIGHRNPVKRAEKKIICSVMLEVTPEKGRVALSISHIYKNVMLPLIKAFNVRAVLADRWNSLKILQDIYDDTGIFADQYSVRYNDMQLVKNHIIDGTIVIPKSVKTLDEILKDESDQYPLNYIGRPVDHFMLQCCTVKDTGREILKGSNLTDDLWRAFALMSTHLLDDDFCHKHVRGKRHQRLETGVVAASLLSGSGVSSYGGQANMNPDTANRVLRVAAASSGSSVAMATGVFARNVRNE